MKRRTFIKVAGASLLCSGAGIVGWSATRSPTSALAAWQLAGSSEYADPRLRMLSYAILAPNPHNRQPWMFELIGDNIIEVLHDPAKMLPNTDPQNRQITVGYGCMLELLAIAARELGYEPSIVLFPDGTSETNLDERRIATVTVTQSSGVVKDPMFSSIVPRRTNREAHDMSREVDETALALVLGAARAGAIVGGTTEPARLQRLRDLTIRAIRIEWTTHRCHKETVDLIRIGKAEIQANPDGIALRGPMMEALKLAGQLERKDMLDTSSSTFKNAVSAYEVPFTTSMGFVWLASADNTRVSQIESGRSWVRMNLAATSVGLGVQPASQALQEYAEMSALYSEVHSMLGVATPATLQILARVGYAPATAASPRWPLSTKLRT